MEDRTRCNLKHQKSRAPFLETPEIKLFGPEKPSVLKLRSAYFKKLVSYHDFKIQKNKFVAKFDAWKRLRF